MYRQYPECRQTPGGCRCIRQTYSVPTWTVLQEGRSDRATFVDTAKPAHALNVRCVERLSARELAHPSFAAALTRRLSLAWSRWWVMAAPFQPSKPPSASKLKPCANGSRQPQSSLNASITLWSLCRASCNRCRLTRYA